VKEEQAKKETADWRHSELRMAYRVKTMAYVYRRRGYEIRTSAKASAKAGEERRKEMKWNQLIEES